VSREEAQRPWGRLEDTEMGVKRYRRLVIWNGGVYALMVMTGSGAAGAAARTADEI
jgi:hypothetical protein